MTNYVKEFQEITKQMSETYERKNTDYGNSFAVSVQKYGLIAALTRISDKFNRMENLILTHNQQVNDESLSDTLLDLATYCIMTTIELNHSNNKN